MDSQPMMLERTFPLSGGARVRLRLARSRDFSGLSGLLSSSRAGGELEAARLVRFDPRRRVVICASTLDAGAERLVAVGAIELSGDQPELVVSAPEFGEELAELIGQALVRRAHAHAANHAA